MSDYQPKKSPSQWISIQEAAHHAPYSQEYLSLLARRGKIFAKKIGRNWYTTHEALERYVSEQALLSPISKQFGSTVELASAPSNLMEEFRRLNPQAFTPQESKPDLPNVSSPAPTPIPSPIPDASDNTVLQKLDRLSDSLETFAASVSEAIPAAVRAGQPAPLDPELVEFIQQRNSSKIHRFSHFNRFANFTARSPIRLMTIMVTAVVLLFILVGGFSFGQVDDVVQQIKKAFTDATTIQGHFAGTHANDVLILDKAGNINIYGHIETQGQLRSHAPDGVAPLVVDSMTKVDNLNADYLDNLQSKDFSLAFVTKNGNLTYEDVNLEGNVEIGKTLIIKGATKLMDSLQVYGSLGVFSDAVFGKNVTLTGGNLTIEKGNLNITKGTITINDPTLIKNLNAEFLDGLSKSAINLQFVTSNGSSTNNAITVGGLNVNGTSQFNGVGFFNNGVWGSTGSFVTVGADTIAANKSLTVGDKNNPSAGTFQAYTSQFSVDQQGNTTIGGTSSENNLIVRNFVLSDLVPSGSFNLGSLNHPWATLFTNNLVVSGSTNFSGTTSRSFVINTDNATADNENAYLAFSRGTIKPSAKLTWNPTAKQFELNEPLVVASGSFTVTPNGTQRFRVSDTGASLSVPFEVSNTASIGNTLYVQNNGNVGIGTTASAAKLHVFGTGTTAITIENSTFGSFNAGLTVKNNTGSTGSLSINSNGVGGSFTNGPSQGGATILQTSGGALVVGGGNGAVVTYFVSTGTTKMAIASGNTGTGINIYSGAAGQVPMAINGFSAQTADLFQVTSSGGVSGNILDISSAGNIGIGTTAPLTKFNIHGGTASVSYMVVSNALNAALANAATVSYSRFGIGTTTHGLSVASDLLISGKLEVDGSAYFDGTTNFNIASASLFYADNGTAASPSFSFRTDQDTGMFHPTTNQLAFSTLGAERLRIDNTGNVGIGATGPEQKLEVGGNIIASSSGNVDFILRSATTTGAANNNDTKFTIRAGSTSERFDIINGAGAKLMSIASNGNVGIGTTSPRSLLNLFSSSTILILDSSGANGAKNIRFDSAAAAKWELGHVSGSNEDFQIWDSAVGAIMTFEKTGGVANSLYVKQGNVGIGTTNPGNKLTVAGTIDVLPTNPADAVYHATLSSVQGTTTLQTFNNSLTITSANLISMSGVGNGGGGAIISLTSSSIVSGDATDKGLFKASGTYNPTSTAAEFQAFRIDPTINETGSATGNYVGFAMNVTETSALGTNNRLMDLKVGGTSKFLITSAGNVGIGTTGPLSKLDVNGGVAIGTYAGVSAAPSNGLIVSGNVGFGTKNIETNFELVGTASISGNLLVGGFSQVNGTSSSSFAGLLELTGVPSGTGISQGSLYINPHTSGVSNVLFGAAVGGVEQARLDASGNFSIVGYFNSSNSSATSQLAGNLSVLNNTTFGDTGSDSVTFNARVNSNIVPTTDNQFNLGSPTKRFANLYAVNAVFTTNTNLPGTTSNSFTINTDNVTADTEDSYLAFHRGSSTPDAKLTWNSTLKQFSFNFPVSLNGALLGQGTSSSSFNGPVWFTGTPTGTNISNGSIYINPSTAGVNNTVLGVAVNGVSKFKVDAEGDTFVYSGLTVTNEATIQGVNGLTLSGASAPITFSGGGTNIISSTGGGTLQINAFTLGGLVSGNNQSITGLNNLAAKTASLSSGLEIIGTASVSGVFQAGTGGAGTAVGYSRFGTGVTNHSLSAPSDLLISGKLEVLGNTYFNSVGSTTNFNIASASYFYAHSDTAASPSFAFTTDQDTGIFNPALNQLGFSTFGVERARFDSAGNFGIGTTNIDAKLEVAGTASISGAAVFGGQPWPTSTLNQVSGRVLITSTNNPALILNNTNNPGSGQGSEIYLGARGTNNTNDTAYVRFLGARENGSSGNLATSLDIKTMTAGGSETQAIHIDSAGFVGINTTAPSALLHVSKDVSGAEVLAILGQVTTGQSVGDLPMLEFNTGAIAGSGGAARIGGIAENASGGTHQTGFVIYTDNQAGSGLTEKVRVSAGGNVGIGATTPEQRLEVGGNIIASSSGNVDFILRSATTNGASNNNDAQFTLRTGSSSERFDIINGAGTKLISIASNGNVGIGTTTPDQTVVIQSVGSSDKLKLYTSDRAWIASTGLLDIAAGSGTTYFYNGNVAQTIQIFDTQTAKIVLNSNGSSYFTGGNLGIGTTAPGAKLDVVSDVIFREGLQVAGTATASYSRFGTSTTTHGLSVASDLLISGKLEVDGSAYFDGTTNFNIASASLFYADNGTAASPSFSFRTDQDTGMFHPTTNQLAFSTLGAERLRIDNTGNVGIGTTVPLGLLQSGSTTITGGNLPTSATSLYAVTANGVWTDTNGAGQLMLADGTNSILADNGGVISFAARGATNTMVIHAGIRGLRENSTNNDFSGYLQFLTRAGSGSNTEKMRITSSGNVGIGTTSPDSLLELSSTTTNFIIRSTGATSSASMVFQPSGGASSSNQGKFSIEVGGTGPTSESMRFENANNLVLMTIASSGNVGIGTTSPGEKLDVSGTFRASGQNSAPTSGSGVEVSYGGGIGYIQSFDRGAGVNSPLYLSGNILQLNGGGEGLVGIGTTTPTATYELTVASASAGIAIKSTTTTASASLAFLPANATSENKFTIQAGGLTSTAGERLDFINGAGTKLMTIASSGNVGIGTTVPSSLLVIKGTAPASAITLTIDNAQLTDAAATAEIAFKRNAVGAGRIVAGRDDTYSAVNTTKDSNLQFWLSLNAIESERMRITSAGNVGIGTTSPDSILEIASASSQFIIRSTGATSSASIAFQPAGGASSSNQNMFTIQAGGLSSTNGERLDFMNGSNVKLMTIASSGNVGIGTTVPNTALEVKPAVTGGVRITGSTTGPISPFYSLYDSSTLRGAFGLAEGSAAFSNDAAAGDIVLRADTGKLILQTGTGASSFVINGGNVGIGTTTPGAKLSVAGNMKFTFASSNNRTIDIADAGASDPTNLILNGSSGGTGNGNVILGTRGNVGIGTTNPAFLLDVKASASYTTSDLFEIASSSPNKTLFIVKKSGNVGIGTTTPTQALHLYGTVNGNEKILIQNTSNGSQAFSNIGFINDSSNQAAIFLNSSGNSNYGGTNSFNIDQASNNPLTLATNDTVRLTITGAGKINFTSALGTGTGGNYLCIDTTTFEVLRGNGSICTTSSQRFKQNIQNIDYGLADIMKLRPVSFEYKPETNMGTGTKLGFIAEEVRPIIPELVTIGNDGQVWGFDYTLFTAVLTRAIQQQQAEISSQSSEFDSLQAQVASLSLTVDGLLASGTSGSSNVTVSSGGSPVDVLGTLANAVLTKVQSLWASGDIIAEGIKKTYFATTSTLGILASDISNLAAGWSSRAITISNTADSATAALFTGPTAQAADQSKVNLDNNGNYLATYGVDSTRGDIQLSGSSQIINGEAKVYFDYSFSSIISATTPIRVIVTPTSVMQGQVYVDLKSQYGFTVKELNSQDTGNFDWLVIARRKGFDDITPSPTPTLTPPPSDGSGSTASGSDQTVTPTPMPSDSPSPTPTPSDTPTPDASPAP